MVTALLALLLPLEASAQDIELDFGGRIQSDLRFRVLTAKDPVGPYWAPPELPPGIIRNQNLFNTYLKARSGRFRGVANIDLVMDGYPAPIEGLSDLSDRRVLEPIRFEAHALYLEARDVAVQGLDLRIGQQLVQFGVGDQFNPTNTFNPNDVEDVLLFGDQMANIMVRADYGLGNWTATGVLVPVFKPSLIPSTGALALTNIPRLPFNEEELRWRIHSEAALGDAVGYPTVVGDVNVVLPEASPKNMQFGFNLGGFIGMQDVAVSYYNGFADVPVATASHTTQQIGQICKGPAERYCVDGLLFNNVTLEYPAIQVLGYNMAGELPAFGWINRDIAPLGYRAEVAVVFPEEVRSTLTQDEIAFGPLVQPAGEYDYATETPNGRRPVVLADTPYAKWVLGLDYSFGKYIYVNAQWVHGMLDELGAGDNLFQEGAVVRDGGVTEGAPCNVPIPGLPRTSEEPPGQECAWEILRARQSDLAVVGVDFNFSNRSGLFRLFTITDLTGMRVQRWDEDKGKRVEVRRGAFTKRGYSGVIYPELSWNFGNGFDLAGGALFQLGKPYTKFGDPATGGSFVYSRARYAF